MKTFRVASFQRHPLFDNIAGTITRLLIDLSCCDDQGVHLAVFPECYLQGYACDSATINLRALSVDSHAFNFLLMALAPFKTDIVLGFIERRASGLYNTAAVIRGGHLLGKYAKSHPNEQGFEAGNDYPVFEAFGWKYGINICNDANFSDTAQKICMQGAHLLCYPLNNMLSPAIAEQWRKKSIDNLRQRALETGCWIVSSDVTGEHEGKISYGCTCIVQPDGFIVKKAVERREDIIMFDLVKPGLVSEICQGETHFP